MSEEKTKRPRLTAEQKIEKLKAEAVALEAKVKERNLAAFSKDLESFTKLVTQLHTLYSKALGLQAQLIEVRDEHDIDAWIPDPWVRDTEDGAVVSLFGPFAEFHVALDENDEPKIEAGE